MTVYQEIYHLVCSTATATSGLSLSWRKQAFTLIDPGHPEESGFEL
jgi:hypothetical protein